MTARQGGSSSAIQLATGGDPTFVNDVVVTGDAAWFTDSFRAVLYRLGLSTNGPRPRVERPPLTGDFELVGGFNTNGIEATPDGKSLVIVQCITGKLFPVVRRAA